MDWYNYIVSAYIIMFMALIYLFDICNRKSLLIKTIGILFFLFAPVTLPIFIAIICINT